MDARPTPQGMKAALLASAVVFALTAAPVLSQADLFGANVAELHARAPHASTTTVEHIARLMADRGVPVTDLGEPASQAVPSGAFVGDRWHLCIGEGCVPTTILVPGAGPVLDSIGHSCSGIPYEHILYIWGPWNIVVQTGAGGTDFQWDAIHHGVPVDDPPAALQVGSVCVYNEPGLVFVGGDGLTKYN